MDLSADIISLINATLRISTPLVFAAMAGLFAERSGVIDFGLEGKMLAAAFVAASGAYVFGSEWYSRQCISKRKCNFKKPSIISKSRS